MINLKNVRKDTSLSGFFYDEMKNYQAELSSSWENHKAQWWGWHDEVIKLPEPEPTHNELGEIAP